MNIKQKSALLMNFLFYAIFGVAAYFVLKYAFAYMVPFLISFVFVYLSQTPAIALQRKTGIPKNVLTIIFLIIIILSISGILIFMCIKIFGLFGDWFSNGVKLEDVFLEFCELVDNTAKKVPNSFKRHVSFDSTTVVTAVSNYFSKFALSLFEDLIRILPGLIFSTVISLVFACFLAFDYDNIITFIKRQLNDESIELLSKFKSIANYSLFNFFKGYLILTFITFAEICLGLTLIGIENAIALSFIIAIVDLLPVFGTGIILVPWSLYLFLVGDIKMGIAIFLLYVFCAIIRNFIEPKIIGRKVGLSPLISLLTMFIGVKFFGITGLIAFPVITSIILILQKNGYIKLWK